MSTPPVSISRNCSPFHSAISSLRSRVVPWVSCTTAWRVEVSRLISVDLPTLGKPTIATVPCSSIGSTRRQALLLTGSVLVIPAAHPVRASLRVHLGEPVEEHVDPPLDLDRRLLVALAALRQALETQRLAERDRERREVADLPELGAVDRDRDHGHVLLNRNHRRARLRGARAGRRVARALDEEADGATVTRRLRASGARRRGRTRRAAPRSCHASQERPRPGKLTASALATKSMLRGETTPTSGMSIQCMWLIA